jgi:hypothetical protein
VNVSVEIFDLDMQVVIWPMEGDEDHNIWLPKELVDIYSDEQLGRWFLNRYLIDYGNSYAFTVVRGEEKEMIFSGSNRVVKDIKIFLFFWMVLSQTVLLMDYVLVR